VAEIIPAGQPLRATLPPAQPGEYQDWTPSLGEAAGLLWESGTQGMMGRAQQRETLSPEAPLSPEQRQQFEHPTTDVGLGYAVPDMSQPAQPLPRGPGPSNQPLLDPDQVNKMAGGENITNEPLPLAVAVELVKQRKEAYDRDLKLSKYAAAHPWSFYPTAAVVGIADPYNIGAMLIPGVGEEITLSALGRVLPSTLAKVGSRAIAGSSAMALGGLPFALIRPPEEGADWSAYDNLKQLAAMSAIAAVLHTGFGAIKDRFAAKPLAPTAEGAPAPADAVANAEANVVLQANQERNRAAMQIGISQIADGRPLDIMPVMSTDQFRSIAEEASLRQRLETIDVLQKNWPLETPAPMLEAERTAIQERLSVLESQRGEQARLTDAEKALIERRVVETLDQLQTHPAVSIEAARDQAAAMEEAPLRRRIEEIDNELIPATVGGGADPEAAEALSRVRAIDVQLAQLMQRDARLDDVTIPIEERRALSEQRDQGIEQLRQRRADILDGSTPEQLAERAWPGEETRRLMAEREAVQGQLQDLARKRTAAALARITAAGQLPEAIRNIVLPKVLTVERESLPSLAEAQQRLYAEGWAESMPQQEFRDADQMVYGTEKPAEGAAAAVRKEAEPTPDQAVTETGKDLAEAERIYQAANVDMTKLTDAERAVLLGTEKEIADAKEMQAVYQEAAMCLMGAAEAPVEAAAATEAPAVAKETA
jgi:hypothetical protein